MAFPRAWVDAASGASAADADGLATYWRERLAPPPPEATRPLKDRAALEAETLLEADDAARRIAADERYLRRLAQEGVLPALRVDGGVRFDAGLTDLVAAEAQADASRLASRRDQVAQWTRFEYASGLDAGAAPPPSTTRPAAAPTVAAAPRAWHLPTDLGEDLPEPTPQHEREGLAAAEGFETVDEDD